ncbi:MAG: hypothetical protein JRS35_01500 [Deltaproteobacteria bacterium]|nr:hypothetical protein [Deltaproteobacteria bacterium]
MALLPACSSAVFTHHTRALPGALAFFDLLFNPLLSSSLGLLLRLSLGVLHFLSLFGDRQAQLLLGAGSRSDAFCRSCGISRRLGCVLLALNLCAGSFSRLSG